MEPTDGQKRADQEELQRIAANVRRLRNERDWSQAYLTERAGIDEKQVQRIEAGRINFGVCWLLRVARTLEVSLGDLTLAPDYDATAVPSPRALAACGGRAEGAARVQAKAIERPTRLWSGQYPMSAVIKGTTPSSLTPCAA